VIKLSYVSVLSAVLTLLLSSGCGSTAVVQNLSAEELFARGKQHFENGDYLDAVDDCTAVTVQYPGSSKADDAQYYLGESRFAREEYLLAAYEYETLRRTMSSSPYAADAQYKIGLCYYMLSPKSPLDQQYAKKAIDELQNFLEYFPTHALALDAERKIAELNNRLAKKDYDTAILYMTMERFKAATTYFDNVLELYHDTEYAEPSHVGKIRAFVARGKYRDAKIEVETFLAKYPDSRFRSTIQSLESEIDSHLRTESTTRDTIPSRSVAIVR